MTYLTSDISGIGGVIKQRPEDFFVEELPLYEACGDGEHLFLFVQKKGHTTTEVARRLANVFHVRIGDVAYAGLKDKNAVARQHFSIHLPGTDNEKKYLDRVGYTGVTLLWAKRHTNKLRRGHLAGNGFVIYIRDVAPDSGPAAERIVDRLLASGVPNYIGHQRFGYRGENDRVGQFMLTGQWQQALDVMLGEPREIDSEPMRAGRAAYDSRDYEEALKALPRHLRIERRVIDMLRQGKSPQEAAAGIDAAQRRFFTSALQSRMFNTVLAKRIADGLFDKLIDGDLAWKHDSRAVFAVDAETAEYENAPGGRVTTKETSPSGPMWGSQMTLASAAVAKWERQVLDERGLTDADLMGNAIVSAKGSRRSMRQFLINPQVSDGQDDRGAYVRLAFQLDRGGFATVAIDEIIKPDVSA